MTSWRYLSIEQLSQTTAAVDFAGLIREDESVSRPRLKLMGRARDHHELEAASQRNVTVPPVRHYRINNPIVVDDGIVLVDGYAISESVRDFHYGHYKYFSITSDEILLHVVPHENDIGGLLLKKKGNTNYGHWLIELLPKLFLLSSTNTVDHVIVHKPSPGFEFISTMYRATIGTIRRHIKINPIPRVATRVAAIDFVTGVSSLRNFFNPAIVDMVEHIKKNTHAREGNRKLFVIRPRSAGRQLVNTDEVERFFVGQGFEIIEPSSLRFEEQVKMFSEAKEVFGIMGAAMCNTIFSPKTARVGYISPSYMLGSFYLEMETAMKRNEVSMIFGPSVTMRANSKDDFFINLDDIKKMYFEK